MRRRKGRRDTISFGDFKLFAFGGDAELVAGFGFLEAAESRWHAVREEFLERWDLWGMPAAWWRFEPGIPEDLRRGPDAILTDADADAWRRIEQSRRLYLVSIGIDPTPPRRCAPFGAD